jgi:hypothetical protein
MEKLDNPHILRSLDVAFRVLLPKPGKGSFFLERNAEAGFSPPSLVEPSLQRMPEICQRVFR